MAEKRTPDTAEIFLRKVQDAAVDTLNARASGRPARVSVEHDEFQETIGWMMVHGYLRRERDRVVRAFYEYRKVLSGELPIPVKREPDIEPFFLP